MIDSSIGGKTAVDLGDTKNIVGAFWQPCLLYTSLALGNGLLVAVHRAQLGGYFEE